MTKAEHAGNVGSGGGVEGTSADGDGTPRSARAQPTMDAGDPASLRSPGRSAADDSGDLDLSRLAGITWTRGLGRRLWQYSAARGGMLFVGSVVAVNLSNFVFHVVLSRLLGPDGYGALGALLNVTAMLSVPLAALQVSVAQSIARREDPSETPPLGRLLRISAVAAVVVAVLWLAATPTVDRFFHLTSPAATIVISIWLLPAVVGSVLEGVLLGQQRFRAAAMGQLVGGAASRLVAGIVLVELGFGVAGGVAATVVVRFATLAIYAWVLRAALGRGGRFVPRAGDAALSIVALGGVSVLTSIDAWLARHFLSPHAAGLFTAAATAGRMAMFLPGAFILVYMPRLSANGGKGPAARQALARVTGLVAVIGLGAAGALAVAPGLAVDVLFGSAFSHAAVAIGTVALADAGLVFASCFVYFQVARRSRLALAAWPTCALALVLAALFHRSIEILALDMLVASGAMVVSLGVPTLVAVVRGLADDSASLPRQPILQDSAEVDLSLVVPFRNVGPQRVAQHLDEICHTLETCGASFEIIAVSDGSTDGSERAVAELPSHQVRPIIWSDNHGKGEALRAGMARGRGRYLGFIDGDGDIPAAGLASFVQLVRREQAEIVIGSKRHHDAQVVYPPLRRLYSFGYQVLVALLFGVQVRDTQTGVKLIRRDVVAEVLPRMLEKRFAFDLELLAVAHRLGYRQVAELPVTIGERFTSTISLRAVWRMLQDTLAIFWRLRVLRFYDPPLLEADPEAGAARELSTRGPAARDLARKLQLGERLRILVCSQRDTTHLGAGADERAMDQLLRAWAAAGHQVTWFVSSVDGRPSTEQLGGITLVRRGDQHSVYREARQFFDRLGRSRFDLLIDDVGDRPFEVVRWSSGTPVVALVRHFDQEGHFGAPVRRLASIDRFFLEARWLRRLRVAPVLTTSASSAIALREFGLPSVTVVGDPYFGSRTLRSGALLSELAARAGSGDSVGSSDAEQLLLGAAEAVSTSWWAAQGGEDIRVAWRRWVAPLSAMCNRRLWVVAGVAALVALAPLSEAGANGLVAPVAGVALGCLCLATLGTLADVWREHPWWRTDDPAVGGGGSTSAAHVPSVPSPRRTTLVAILPMLLVGLIGAAAVQSWYLGGPVVVTSTTTLATSATWFHQLVSQWPGSGSHVAVHVVATEQLPLGVLSSVVHFLHGSAVLTERIWLSLLFAMVGMGAVAMLRALGLGLSAQVVGGIAYGFSPYVISSAGTAPAYLAAMALAPTVAALVLVAGHARRPRWWWWSAWVVAAMLLGVVASSPPLVLATAVVAIGAIGLAGWTGGRGALLPALRRGALGGVILLVASAYWAVPFVDELFTTRIVSVAAHQAWLWSEARATLANGFWLNTAWSWGYAAYSPFADDFARFPLVLWKYVLPAGAFVSVALAGMAASHPRHQQRLRILAFFAVGTLVLTVLSTGTRPPGAALFDLLAALPYGWLLREPGRFLYLAGLGYATMVAVGVEQAVDRRRAVRPAPALSPVPVAPLRRALIPVVWCAVLAIPAYPLIVGSVAQHRAATAETAHAHENLLGKAPLSSDNAHHYGEEPGLGTPGRAKAPEERRSHG